MQVLVIVPFAIGLAILLKLALSGGLVGVAIAGVIVFAVCKVL